MNDTNTESLYNKTAQKWQRREPSSLSDFTGRPPVLDLCGDVKNLDVLDLGCGEGYCTRILANSQPKTILGLDISEEMIQLAKDQEEKLNQGIIYKHHNATELSFVTKESKDLILAVFLFNYLDTHGTLKVLKEVFRILKPGGNFVFSIPHPLFAFIKKETTPPFYFNTNDTGYFSGTNSKHEGKIWRRNGTELNVQLIHKKIEDYFDLIAQAGFTQLPVVKELGVLDEHLNIDKDFFSPVYDIPLHMAIKLKK